MLQRRWSRIARAALVALTVALFSGCVGDSWSDSATPVEGWSPEDGFVQNWDR